jgi:Concanavalin A-like lectin/glucanases superfamily
MANAFQSDAFQSDAFESGGGAVEGSLTAAAVLLRAQSGTYVADAVIFKSQSGTWTADAVLTPTMTGSLTADAILAATQSGSWVVDAALLRGQAGSFTADSSISVSIAGSFSTDAIILKTQGAVTLYRDIVLADTPLHYWRLEETSGTVAADSGSSPISGTIKSSVTLGVAANSPTPGGTAFSFPGNGTTGYVWMSGVSVAYAQYSIEAWVKSSSSGGIAGRGYSPGTMLYYSGGTAYFYKNGSVISKAASSGAWHHIVGTFDGSQMRIYVDGTSSSPLTASGTPTDNRSYVFAIGGYNASSSALSGPLIGQIDEVAFYTYALSQTRISAHLAGGAGAGLSFTANAVIFKTITPTTKTADAIKRQAFSGSLTADAETLRGFLANAQLIGRTTGSFTANAFIARLLTANAVIMPRVLANAVIAKTLAFSYAADAVLVAQGTLPANAIFRRAASGSFIARAELVGLAHEASIVMDAWITGTVGSFSADALLVEPTRTSSFGAYADIKSANERRYSLTAETIVLSHRINSLTFSAVLAQGFFRANAYVAWYVRTDAVLTSVRTYSLTANAFIAKTFTTNAVITKTQTGSLNADAIIANGTISLNAVISGTRTRDIQTAAIIGMAPASLTADAIIARYLTASAFIQPYFTANAYIRGNQIIIFPPGGGTPTDPFGGPPPISRSFRLKIEVGRYGGELLWPAGSPVLLQPGRFKERRKIDWEDVTADVVFAQTEFTQQAKTGAGTFTLTLNDTFDYVGGEEVRVTVDDLVIFGGIVQTVTSGYFFSDFPTGKTVLAGTDYNILFDRIIAYNMPWVQYVFEHITTLPAGEYQHWKPWKKGTSDKALITQFCEQYLDIPYDVNFTDYVDAITTPNADDQWTIDSGSFWRQVMAGITQITKGVFWLDPYKNLHYHDRSTITARFPITDGDGGISCRNLTIQSDISQMINESLVWGTMTRNVSGDIYAKHSQDTLSIAEYGRWQAAEFRSDVHTQSHVNARSAAILERWSEPIIRAQATIWEPGYQAGQVVQVKSAAYGVDATLVIRELRITFPIALGPDGSTYYAVPQYDLVMGLDPEAPWNVYDALPFEGFDTASGVHTPKFEIGWPKFWLGGLAGAAPCPITDTWERTIASGWGVSDAGITWVMGGFGPSGVANGRGFLSNETAVVSGTHRGTTAVIGFPVLQTLDLYVEFQLDSPLCTDPSVPGRVSVVYGNNVHSLAISNSSWRIASLSPVTFSPGTDLCAIRIHGDFDIAGQTIVKAKVWKLAESEPDWQQTDTYAIDGWQPFTQCNLRLVVISSSCPVNTVYFDNLDITGVPDCRTWDGPIETFTHTGTSGWGISELNGQPYSLLPDNPPTFVYESSKTYIESGKGVYNNTGGGNLPRAVYLVDPDLLAVPVEITIDSNDNIEMDLWASAGDDPWATYTPYVYCTGGGYGNFSIFARDNSGYTDTGSYFGYASGFTGSEDYPNGTDYMRLKFRVEERTVRLKAWKVGTSEPSDWFVMINDPNPVLTAGYSGIRAVSFSYFTDPGIKSWDNIRIAHPSAAGSTGAVGEGWGCEPVTVTNGEFSTTKPPARGTLSVYDSTGKLMIKGTDYKYSGGTGQLFSILTGTHETVTCCYLAFTDSLRAQPSSPKTISQNIPADRLRLLDIRGV